MRSARHRGAPGVTVAESWVRCVTVPRPEGCEMSDLHQQFLEFTEQALRDDRTESNAQSTDLHQILACLAEGGDIYALMSRVPDDEIANVLTWVMNTDMPDLG